MPKTTSTGMIDMHVHFREPGIENKGTIKTRKSSSGFGGITSIMEMPNTKPAAITNKILEDKYKIASKSCLTNYSCISVLLIQLWMNSNLLIQKKSVE